ncbi:MAG: GMP synthase subunit A [Sulfolobus sp.]|nr:GMP synthase subunit A [Sulfolobus sp.]MBP1358216.1 GMP synthase subunit A [Sulfolobus sp.]
MLFGVVIFGGQYNHLIIKNLRNLGVDVIQIPFSQIELFEKPDCVVLGGGPQSVIDNSEELSQVIKIIPTLRKPILGICLGFQVLSASLGGKVVKSNRPEYGLTEIQIDNNDTILDGIPRKFNAWESHSDEVLVQPENFDILARSTNDIIQAISNEKRGIFGVQFHPEVKHTRFGVKVFSNFISYCKK